MGVAHYIWRHDFRLPRFYPYPRDPESSWCILRGPTFKTSMQSSAYSSSPCDYSRVDPTFDFFRISNEKFQKLEIFEIN